MRPRGQLAIVFITLAALFALAAVFQIDRATSMLADGLDDSGHLLINQIYEQMRDALSGAKGDPAAVLGHDARLAAFLASTEAFGRGVVYARIARPDGAAIAGFARSDSTATRHAPAFAELAARAHSAWPPARIAALWRGRTYEMTHTVMMSGKPFAVIEVGLSTGLVAAEARRDAERILGIGAAGVALSLLGVFFALRRRKAAPLTLSAANRVPDARDIVSPRGDGHDEMAALAERFDELSNRIRLSGSQSRLGQKRLLQIVRSISDGIMLLDSGGAILFTNSEAQGRIGLPAGGLDEGKPLISFIGRDSALARMIDTARSTGTEIRDVTVEAEGGSRARLLVSVFALGHGPEPPGMLVVMRDLDSIREFEAVLEHAEQLARLAGLIAGIGGRIRAPLNAVGARLDQVRQEAARGLPVDRKIADLRGEIDRLERAVDALLIFMRPERLELAPVRINAMLAKVARAVSGPGVKLDYRLDNAVGEVLADRALIAEALRHVMANAVEAMPSGGQLTIATAPRAGGFAEITVADTGHGIDPENLKRIFDPFFTTTKRRSGVGLSLALRAVELHRGTIDVKSVVGTGTTVTIRLPLAGRRAAVIALRSA